MARKRQRDIALAVVAIALIATAAWRIRSATSPAAGGPSGAPAANRERAAQKSPLTEVDLEALQAERPEPEESNRNPFRFRPKPPPPQPSAAVRQQQQSPSNPTGPVGPPPPPRIPLKYIGDMDDPAKPGGRVAILSDARGVYYGREGEIIEGRYRSVKIGVESIDLAYLDGRGRQTIRQTGQ